jgi:DcuC family C4-dicarboxylate transporter
LTPADPVIAVLGLAIIAAAALAVIRRVDVRIVMSVAAVALGLAAGQLPTIVQTLLTTFSREQFVLPICSAMGFAHVLRYTGCDQHLVQLLVKPLRRVRFLLVPGTVVVGFLVNVPIISQTSTAATVGPVMLPLLHAAGISPASAGAALLLGSSIGGELLNPGAPEFRTITEKLLNEQLRISEQACVRAIAAPLLLHLGLATLAFWWWNARIDRREAADQARQMSEKAGPAESGPEPEFRVNLLKAMVPIVPLVLLFLTAPPLEWVHLDQRWLVGRDEANAARLVSGRLVGLAMLVGVLAAAMVSWRRAGGMARALFEGAGYAFTHIISLIVCAYAFGRGVEVVGLAGLLGEVIRSQPHLLFPCAAGLPLLFAILCGSGFAATQSLFGFFVQPALHLGVDPLRVGATVSLSAAAGRSLSPVGAVNLFCAQMTGTTPFMLARRVGPPVLASLAITLVVRSWLTW